MSASAPTSAEVAAAAAALAAATPFAWSNGAFANGTGPATLPVLDAAHLPRGGSTPFPVLKNDLILRTARGEQTERTPVWCHRQAGRYLPEFRDTRKIGGFFTMCQTPTIAVELTLQPIRRFALDAAIIFSDILVIPQALGMEVLMKEAVGPVLPDPIRTIADLSRLRKREEVDVPNRLGYVLDAIHLCRHSLAGTVPLIGFCGAPYTLMCYMVEGGGAKSYTHARKWLVKHPEESHQLLGLITSVLVEYLILQVEAGAQMLEVFDTWVGELTAKHFKTFILPRIQELASKVKAGLKARGLPNVPMTLFPKGADYCLAWVADQTEFDVISLDWSTSASDAHTVLTQSASVQSGSRKIALQGNLDPAVFYADEAQIRQEARDMIDEFDAFGKGVNHIANLGHGMLPDHPLESLRVYVDEVHNYSAIKKAQAVAAAQ